MAVRRQRNDRVHGDVHLRDFRRRDRQPDKPHNRDTALLNVNITARPAKPVAIDSAQNDPEAGHVEALTRQ